MMICGPVGSGDGYIVWQCEVTPDDSYKFGGILGKSGGGVAGKELQKRNNSQEKKPKCKQDKNGGDRNDIEDKLSEAGVVDNISRIRSAAPKSPEGITFDITNRQVFVSTIIASGRFTQDIPAEHLRQVGGNARNTAGFRSFSGEGNGGLGPDRTGFTRSLQIAVGPVDPLTGLATGYADLDCDNPDQDVKSAFKHIVPIILRRMGIGH